MQAIAHFITSLGPWAPLGLILALVAQQVFPLVPSSALIALGGALFGAPWGFFYSWIGVVLSAILCYRIGREGGSWSRRFLGNPALLRTLEAKVQQGGGLGIFLVRALPIFPFNLVSVLSGGLRLPFGRYLLATMLGILPGLWLWIFLGHGLTDLYAWLKTYFFRM